LVRNDQPRYRLEKRKITYRTIASHISSRHPRNISKPCSYQAQGSKVKVPLIVGARAFMRAAKNGNVFAIYATPTREPVQGLTKLPTQYDGYRDVFEKKTPIRFPNIDLMIVVSNFKKVRNPHLVQSIAFPRTNLRHCESILMKISQRTSFDTPSHLPELLSYLLRRRTVPCGCVWTIVA